MISSAQLSEDGLHRFTLERIWDSYLEIVLFIMLNPSTADASINDPTILRCIAFAKAWGYGGLRVVNLVSYRTKSPKLMYDNLNASDQSVNRRVIMTEARRDDVGIVVCAWGSIKPLLHQHSEVVLREIQLSRSTYAIKVNKDGSPAHPLYQKGHLVPCVYPQYRASWME